MRWISAHNLHQWSNSLAARTTFPGLIADLITAAAPNITEFRFPNRERGQVRGFDGVLEATGVPPFVPGGASIWEFGVTADVVEKAEGDFENRTKNVDATVRANTTFVFATPRTWDRPSKQISDWLSEKRALGQWKGVECLDGVALEHWLDRHPAVASRYARYELGLAPTVGAISSSEFWDEFSTLRADSDRRRVARWPGVSRSRAPSATVGGRQSIGICRRLRRRGHCVRSCRHSTSRPPRLERSWRPGPWSSTISTLLDNWPQGRA